MPYMIDERSEHVMRSWMKGGYVTLAWPHDLELKWLKYAKEAVNFQLDIFIAIASRENACELEWQSWLPVPA